MARTDEALKQAELLGRIHGVDAASWYFDGNTSPMVYEATLSGIEDGDPMVLDTFPSSPLSGEWADSFSMRDLAEEFGVDTEDYEQDCWLGMLAAAYEDGFHSAVSDTIESSCRDYVEGASA